MNYFILATLFMSALNGISCDDVSHNLKKCQAGTQLAMEWAKIAPNCYFFDTGSGYLVPSSKGSTGCLKMARRDALNAYKRIVGFAKSKLQIGEWDLMVLFGVNFMDVVRAQRGSKSSLRKIYKVLQGLATKCLRCSNELSRNYKGFDLLARAMQIFTCQVTVNIAKEVGKIAPQCNVLAESAEVSWFL